jgi:hypothetical protein
MPSHHYHCRHHLTGNQIHTTGNNFGKLGNTSGNNLSLWSQPTNQHTPAQSQSAEADFAARSAFRRGFNRWPDLPTTSPATTGNRTGKNSGNKIGKTGNAAQSSLHNAIPGHISLSAIGNHHKKRNRGKNGNAPRMLHHTTIPSHTPSGNLTGKHSGKKSATLPATSATHNPYLPNIATSLPHPNARIWESTMGINCPLPPLPLASHESKTRKCAISDILSSGALIPHPLDPCPRPRIQSQQHTQCRAQRQTSDNVPPTRRSTPGGDTHGTSKRVTRHQRTPAARR